jgi:hypothetical protein
MLSKLFMDMKKLLKYFLVFLLPLAAALAIMSCTDEEETSGAPVVDYVRVTDPNASDSLLGSGYMGSMVAIIGNNLSDIREIYFNDQPAFVNPNYVTDKSILVVVPNLPPVEVNNAITLIFKNGSSITHGFLVDIPAPELESMNCEYVDDGGVAVLNGDFYFEPITVTFPGGLEAEVLEVDKTQIRVKVPEGAGVGPVTVSTNFGTTVSDYYFRDNRNIFIDSDPYIGWWRESLVTSTLGPEPISGNYIYVRQTISEWQWFELAGGPPDAMGDNAKRIPDEAMTRPDKYLLKFEINTLKPFNANGLKINVGSAGTFDVVDDAFVWPASDGDGNVEVVDTEAEWRTIVIPFEQVTANTPKVVSPEGYYIRIWFHYNRGALAADLALDNFRVVPAETE